MQCVWAVLLTLSGSYNDLLDYVIFAVLLFYILTIAGLFVLRRTRPDLERPYKAFGYPVLPALYIVAAGLIEVLLLLYKPNYTWPGLIIVLLGLPVYFIWRRKATIMSMNLFADEIARADQGRIRRRRAPSEEDPGPGEPGRARHRRHHRRGPVLAHRNRRRDNAGPAVVLSFVVAAIGCAFAGMCYSEFSTMIPIAGSAYTYAYATMGELLAWIIGWDLVLEYAVGAATVSVSWSSYVVKLLHMFGIELPSQPDALSLGYDAGGHHQPAGGVRSSCVISFAADDRHLGIGPGQRGHRGGQGRDRDRRHRDRLRLRQPGELHAVHSARTPATFGEFGFSGIMRAAAVIFFAYIGFDAVSTAAQEAKKPQRDMPIGIIGSLAVCTVLYILFARVLTGMVNYTQVPRRRRAGGHGDLAVPLRLAADHDRRSASSPATRR